MNEAQKLYAKGEMPDMKSHVLYVSVYTECAEQGNPLMESRLVLPGKGTGAGGGGQ